MSPTEVLRDVLVVLVFAKLAAEIAERVKIPAVVGEIIAGVLIGPSLLGLVDTSSALEVLAEFGVILLLLQVGMEMDIDELAAVGKASVSVAVLGVILPMIGGYAVGIALGQDSNTSLFLGASLAATSVGITARVFSDLGALTTVEARTVLGAAVADDVLGLVILTIVVKIVSSGSVSAGTIVGTIALAVGFLVVATVLGGRLGVVLFRWIQRNSRAAGTLVALALAFALFFAELADAAKLAPIVGAFVAGLALSRTESRERIARELTPVGYLFIPVFFLADRDRGRGRQVRRPERAPGRRAAARRRGDRQDRRIARAEHRARAGGSAPRRVRNAASRRGRAHLRHDRPRAGRARRGAVRVAPARGPGDHARRAAAPAPAPEGDARRSPRPPGRRDAGLGLAVGRRRRRRSRRAPADGGADDDRARCRAPDLGRGATGTEAARLARPR